MTALPRRLTIVPLLALSLALAACAGREDVRGAVMTKERMDEIRPGSTTQNELIEIIGSPTASTMFPQEGQIWYYISKETKTVAFFEPETLKQEVLEIRFDPSGRVTDIRKYGIDDAKQIALVSRTTPTRGKELSFVEQMFGNIGRFNDRSTGTTGR